MEKLKLIIALSLTLFNCCSSLKWITIGDYGFDRVPGQLAAAAKMEQIASSEHIDFIMGTGDNFYNPNGVSGLNDKNWDTHWANVYQRLQHLEGLTWYGCLGNHDYGGKSIEAQLQYKKHNWRIDDFFWSYNMSVDGEQVAFVHIDTNYLAYGANGEPSKKPMKGYFKKLNWTDDVVLGKIEEQLKKNQGVKYKIAVGHHPIGHSCGWSRNTNKVDDLLQKYGFQAYFHGHAHSLAYSAANGISYWLSGAGGNNGGACGGNKPAVWTKGKVFGFLISSISDGKLSGIFYYTEDKTNWKTWTAPTFDLLKGQAIGEIHHFTEGISSITEGFDYDDAEEQFNFNIQDDYVYMEEMMLREEEKLLES